MMSRVAQLETRGAASGVVALEKKAWGLGMMPSSPVCRAAFCSSGAHDQPAAHAHS